jgi:predicted dehydrogenase
MVGAGPVGVAVIGAGVISRQYLTTLTGLPDIRVYAVADAVEVAAARRAEEFGIPVHGPVEVALAHPAVELVVNLTVPAAHLAVGRRVIAAGKHLWNEKPFAADATGGAQLLEAAAAAGVRTGGAPDTFLGPGLQAALRAVRSEIGETQTALFLMQSSGPEAWHPNADFLYRPGAGPLFDIGPYYLTALVQALGPVTGVAATGAQSRTRRVIGSGERAGEAFDVHVPTHIGALLRFAGGRSAQGILSFDSALRRGLLEIAGTGGTCALPDPNRFDGEVGIWRPGDREWSVTPVAPAQARRGLGVLEMARAIRHGTPHRATGELAYHVLDTMCAIERAACEDGFVEVLSRVEPAALLPEGWDPRAATIGMS